MTDNRQEEEVGARQIVHDPDPGKNLIQSSLGRSNLVHNKAKPPQLRHSTN